jgi:hypothetical protein
MTDDRKVIGKVIWNNQEIPLYEAQSVPVGNNIKDFEIDNTATNALKNLSCRCIKCGSNELEARRNFRNYESCGWFDIWALCKKCGESVTIVDDSW